MQFPRLVALVFATLLLGATPQPLAPSSPAPPSRPLAFSAPAGDRPAGDLDGPSLGGRILPSGRIVRPAGRLLPLERGSQSLALDPSERFIVVGGGRNADGFLTVIDARNLRVQAQIRRPAAGTYADLAIVRRGILPYLNGEVICAGATGSGRVDLFTLSDRGVPSFRQSVALPGAGSSSFPASGERSSDRTMLISEPTGRVIAIDAAGGVIGRIDPFKSRLAGVASINLPGVFGAALAGEDLLVAQRSLALMSSSPPPLSQAALTFERFPPMKGGGFGAPEALPYLDRGSADERILGSIEPTDMQTFDHSPYVLLAMADTDRVVTLSTDKDASAVGSLDLSLYPHAPYGTRPVALARRGDGRAVYAALAGINAIAVLDARDPKNLRRLGLLPSGLGVRALTLSHAGRELFVLSEEGIGIGSALLQRVDLSGFPLMSATKDTLDAIRHTEPAGENPIVPQVLGAAASPRITHVIEVFFGRNIPVPPEADSAKASLDEAQAPNVASLSSRFAVETNFYMNAPDSQGEEELAFCGEVHGTKGVQRLNCLEQALRSHGMRGYFGQLRTESLPRTDGAAVDTPYIAVDLTRDSLADADQALGVLVAAQSHSPNWNSTAIFVLPGSQGDDPAGLVEPAALRRSALVISPYAIPRFRGSRLLTPQGALKTIEAILGLPALSLGDDLASDWSEAFGATLDSAPYDALGNL